MRGQKWLHNLVHKVPCKTCYYSDGVSRKGEKQPPVPGAPMAPPGSTDTGMAGRAGIAGLACQLMLLRISSRAGILFGKG